jgi:beta-ureidopropionase / N-carbamoyl-L-amino-acid hydrolase
MTMPAHATKLAIDRIRFERTLRELAEIGADPRGGLSRLGLSQAENEARAYLSEASRAAGLYPQVDPAGNLLVRRPSADPQRPALLIGSHLDTVVQGGWLDGAYGVVAALEVLAALSENEIECPREPVAVGFANEEGALVQYPFWGSRALTGTLADGGKACDRTGQPVERYLRAFGSDLNRLAETAWAPGSISGYLELHIEQGTVLERRRIPIGVVEAIVGRAIFEISVLGTAGHAGTTAMCDRQDALAAAACLVLKVESIAAELGLCRTATVGYLDVMPNTTNTIPGTVRLTAEIRDTDGERLRTAETVLRSMAASVAGSRDLSVTVRKAHQSDPVATDPSLRAAVENAALSLGLACLAMPSGAGHDAQIVAMAAPVGMIFVPSKDGMSHVPAEDTEADALIAGANVLLHSVLALQDEPGTFQHGCAQSASKANDRRQQSGYQLTPP